MAIITIVNILVALAILFVFGYIVYWIITKTFPEPFKVPALFVLGIIGIVAILYLYVAVVGGHNPVFFK